MRTKNRPSSQDGERSFIERARRSQIIDATVAVIAEDGLQQASLARIAARAGISKGVISYHFTGKDELIREVVTAVYTEAAEGARPDVEDAASHAERLAAYLRGNLSFLARNPQRVRALIDIFSTFRGDDGDLAYDVRSTDPVVEPLVTLLRQGQADGEFTDFDATVMARTIRAAVDAVPPQMTAFPSLDVHAYADQLVLIFTRATTGGAP
ncbi:TetR family transcriptional regulator [Actinomycetospora sp. OC33-EN08]|uniref:TetR family transcriptional regulator n=1 Tax=Actinomycetospora aurantiaca TaxID=3129233 RepID=A0ABU8MTR6_9PSEU